MLYRTLFAFTTVVALGCVPVASSALAAGHAGGHGGGRAAAGHAVGGHAMSGRTMGARAQFGGARRYAGGRGSLVRTLADTTAFKLRFVHAAQRRTVGGGN